MRAVSLRRCYLDVSLCAPLAIRRLGLRFDVIAERSLPQYLAWPSCPAVTYGLSGPSPFERIRNLLSLLSCPAKATVPGCEPWFVALLWS